MGLRRADSRIAGMPGVVKGKKAKAKTHVFIVDCALPVEDKILELKAYAKYLMEHIKVGGKTGNLGEAVKVTTDSTKVTVTSEVDMSKRYIKYLSKRFLKRHNVRDWLRVVASNSDRSTYVLKYFDIPAEDEGEDED